VATTAPSIVNKVWNYAHVLRDDGVSYGDYVEQITYLLFLKMAHEGSTLLHETAPSLRVTVGRASPIRTATSSRSNTATSSKS